MDGEKKKKKKEKQSEAESGIIEGRGRGGREVKFDRWSHLEERKQWRKVGGGGSTKRVVVGVLIAAPRNETNGRTSRVNEGAGVENWPLRQSGSMPPRHVCARKRAHVCVHTCAYVHMDACIHRAEDAFNSFDDFSPMKKKSRRAKKH